DSTVKRHCKALGLSGAGATFKKIDLAVAKQIILYEMEQNITKSAGVHTLKVNIAYNFELQLPW
ncbi:hypothetical protein H0H87_005066, partial [Tephrocybe sp. NHM501043]